MFLTVFFHWMYKMKYSCYQESSVIHGWFVYWVFWLRNSSLVNYRKYGNSISDGIVFVFHLAWCVRGIKSLKQLWPSLIAFRKWISNGIVFDVCFCLNFMKSSTVYGASLCTFVGFESMIWASIGFDISLQNFKKPSDTFSHRKQKENAPKNI